MDVASHNGGHQLFFKKKVAVFHLSLFNLRFANRPPASALHLTLLCYSLNTLSQFMVSLLGEKHTRAAMAPLACSTVK